MVDDGLGMVDGDAVGGNPVLRAVKRVQEGDVVVKAVVSDHTNGRAFNSFPSSRCVH